MRLVHLADADFALQPGFGEFPVADNRIMVNLKRFGDFLHAHTAEIAQLHHLCFSSTGIRQPRKRLVQSNQVV